MKVHIVAHLERYCVKCRKTVSGRVYDYGIAESFEKLDEHIGMNNLPVIPLECPGCKTKEHPQDIVMYNIVTGKMVEAIRTKIGSPDMPVVGGENLPYGVTISPEEQAEYDRGLAKMDDIYKQNQGEFWEQYCSFALSKWTEMLREVSQEEFARGYAELGLSIPHNNASVAMWRKDAEKRFATEKDCRKAWCAINKYLVEQEFVWIPIQTWPIKAWVATYGRERVAYIVLHLPLPEELERWRTEKLGLIIKKRSGETGVLFERIGQLSWELDRQRRRASQMGQTILELRQEISHLRELSARVKNETVNIPTVINRQADDVRKIRELKGLIGELRAEVERLTGLIPPVVDIVSEVPEVVPTPSVEKEMDLSVLEDKSILVVGWPNETVNSEYRVLWHDGDKVDTKLQSLAREANIIVFLTRFGSHAAMWWLKEVAIDMGKQIYYLKERNLRRILQTVASYFDVKR